MIVLPLYLRASISMFMRALMCACARVCFRACVRACASPDPGLTCSNDDICSCTRRQNASAHDDSESKRRASSGKAGMASRQNEDGLQGREHTGGGTPRGRKVAKASWETGLEDDEDVCTRKKVYDRLYHQGVVKVKRQQHLQVHHSCVCCRCSATTKCSCGKGARAFYLLAMTALLLHDVHDIMGVMCRVSVSK